MKNVTYKIIAILFCTLFFTKSFAQITGRPILKEPKNMDEATEEQRSKIDLTETKTNPWEVFSDREGNRTFTTPGGTTTSKTLKLFESFYVVEVQGDFLHLVKDPEAPAPNFSSSAESYGWINKNKMLIWTSCLKTEKGKLTKKAMVLNTIEHLVDISGNENFSPNKVNFLSSPKEDGRAMKESNLFEIFYVFKTDVNEKFVLLGNVSEVVQDAGNDNRKIRLKVMQGWTSVERLTLWNQRVVVEPNWKNTSVNDRKLNDRKIRFFNSKKTAEDYGKNASKLKIEWSNCLEESSDDFPCSDLIWDDDKLLTERAPGYVKRFPILSTDGFGEKTIISAGVMAEIFDDRGAKVATAEEGGHFQETVQEGIVNNKNINIFFLLDATTSMGSFFAPTVEAIRNSISSLEQTENSFRYSAAIYRDEAEDKPGGYGLYDEETSGSAADVISFLDGIRAGDKFDRDDSEAVFYGLNRVFRAGFFREKESNVLILIGDAGNNEDNGLDVSIRRLKNKIVKSHCHFLAFQVNNKGGYSFKKFIPEVKELFFEPASQLYAETISNYGLLGENPPPFPSWEREGNNFSLRGGSYFAELFGAEEMYGISPEFVSEAIYRFILDIEDFTTEKTKVLNKIGNGKRVEVEVIAEELVETDSKNSSKFGPAILKVLRDAGIDDSKLLMLQKNKYQLYSEAFTPLYLQGLDDVSVPVLKKSLLLSRGELGELINQLRALRSSQSGFLLRKHFKETWIKLLQAYDGALTEREIELLTLGEIQEKVFGLPGTAGLLKSMRLSDITNEMRVSDHDIQIYALQIKNKETRLLSIFNTVEEYEFGFVSNGIQYFWLDEKEIP